MARLANDRNRPNNRGGSKPPQKRPPQRRSSGVPPLDAFDDVRRLPPPDLPGYEDERQAHRDKKRRAAPPANRQKPPSKRRRPQSDRRQAPPAKKQRKKRVPKKVDPVKRRRNRRIAAVVTVLLLVFIGIFVSIRVWFKIDSFALEGDETPYSLAEIEAVFSRTEGDNMFSFNKKNEAAAIEQQLPYIENVTIRRWLPGTIAFDVTAAKEQCTLEEDGTVAVLSEKLKILRLDGEPSDKLVQINGLSSVNMVVGLPLSVKEDASPSSQSGFDSAPLGDVSTATEPPSDADANAPPDESDSPSPDSDGGDTSTDSSLPNDVNDTPDEPDETPAAADGTEPRLSQNPKQSLAALHTLLPALQKADLTEVGWVNVANPVDLRFCWQNRIVVRVGGKGQLEKKLKFAHTLLTDTEQSKIGGNDQGTLNLTAYPAVDKVYFTPA